jgi:hypothetical protein
MWPLGTPRLVPRTPGKVKTLADLVTEALLS